MAKSEQDESQSKRVQNKKTNNLILVIFLFALPLLYYFFIHVPQKESEIDARNLRLIRDLANTFPKNLMHLII